MANSSDNLFTEGTRGAVGKQIVFKKINGKTVMAKYPDMTGVQYNKTQKKYQSVFAQAVELAQSVIKDPEKRAEYEKRIAQNQRTRETSVYHFVITEYLKKHSKKVPKHKVKETVQRLCKQYQLTARHEKALTYLVAQGILTNGIYQDLNKVSKPTATRDLQALVKMGVIEPTGKGSGTVYLLLGSTTPELGSMQPKLGSNQ